MSIPELTVTEERIVLLVARGNSTREIAADLGVSARTVDWHLARARLKLERAASLHDRVERATEGDGARETARRAIDRPATAGPTQPPRRPRPPGEGGTR